jgi:hypothetical protein
MKKTLLSLLLFCLWAPSLFADNIPKSAIKPEILKKYLPQGWEIKKTSQIEAPNGWKTIKGDKGIRVDLFNPHITVHDDMVGDYHPFYSFSLIPLNWEGENKLGDTFKNGKITQKEYLSEQQIYPDHFQKKCQGFYIFDSYLGKGDWKNPFEDLQKYFDEDIIL